VIDQQSNSWCLGGIVCIELNAFRLFLFLLLLEQLLIELDEKQSLVTDIRKEVILPNEVKNIGSSQPQEELECLARLTICDVPDSISVGMSQRLHQTSYNSARHSIRIVVSGPLEATFDDDGALSNSDSRATMTEGIS